MLFHIHLPLLLLLFVTPPLLSKIASCFCPTFFFVHNQQKLATTTTITTTTTATKTATTSKSFLSIFTRELLATSNQSINLDTCSSDNNNAILEQNGDENNFFNDKIQKLTFQSIYHAGTEVGNKALMELSDICQERIPFDISTIKIARTTATDNDNDHKLKIANNDIHNEDIKLVRGLLPKNITEQVLQQVQLFKDNQWFSTNLDSVDGLPSLHVNLISNGTPLIVTPQNDFENGLYDLTRLLQPYLDAILLPTVQQMLNDDSIEISDVFLRTYGKTKTKTNNNENNNNIEPTTTGRLGISAHYDVFSRVTSVIALDNVAASGQNGLYTTTTSSNHVAYRRFFPLKVGDGVVHTWNILHGVHVQPGLDRTSLIVWFTQQQQQQDEEMATCNDDNDNMSFLSQAPSWLTKNPNLLYQKDSVTQFVLASALASMEDKFYQDKKKISMEHDLYLQSASQGNSFAMTRMGSLLEQEHNRRQEMLASSSTSSAGDSLLLFVLSTDYIEQAQDAINRIRPIHQLPAALLSKYDKDAPLMSLAKRFWLEGSMRGNILAQLALADELMLECSIISDNNNDNNNDDDDDNIVNGKCLLAAVLFGLAAQQGQGSGEDRLERVVEFELSRNIVSSKEEFMANPIVQIAQIATCNI